MNNVLIKKFDIVINVSSNDIYFLQFIKNYFGEVSSDLKESPLIKLDFYFKSGFSFKINGNTLNYSKIIFGENITQAKNDSFDFKFKELFGEFFFKEDLWTGKCVFQKNFFKHFANLIFFKRNKTQEHYYRFITRLIIQNLLFLRLKERSKFFILSAASIVINNKAYVFAGLPGSGKTTIVKTLKKMLPSSDILAENYVVVLNDKTYCFTEGKNPELNEAYHIDRIFIISRGDTFSINKINADESYNKLRAINEYTAEFPEHSIFVNLLLLSNEFKFIFNNDYLKDYINGLDIYNLVIDNGLSELKNNLKKIYE